MKTKTLKWLLPLGVAGAGLGVLALLNPSTSAQTSADADGALKTRRYNASLDEVRIALEELVPAQKTYGAAWRLTETESYDASTPNASIVMRAEVPVTVFVDDLTVTLRPDENTTVVDARSVSRTRGKSDLGENRRHIVQLLAALDEKLAH